MEDDDPFPHPIAITGRLYPEEQPGEVTDPGPLLFEEIEEQPRAVDLPPLREDEEETTPSIPLHARPDPILDDPATTDGMKHADDCVSRKFLKDHQETLLRPWDDVDIKG
jgi:hypothetical protein